MTALDPFLREHIADPYPFYELLRAAGPVVHLEGRDLWLVSTFDAVREVLRRPEMFLSGLGTGYIRAAVSGIRGPLIDSDPPDHTRIRRSVQRWFNPSQIEARRESIALHVSRLIDDALAAESIDAVAAIARPLPVLVMRDLLGLHHLDPVRVSATMDSVFRLFGPEPAPADAEQVLDLVMWMATEGVDSSSEQTLGQEIINGEGAPDERVGLLFSIWSAGVDTSTNLIGSLLHVLSTHPDQWKLLRDDPALVPAAVEEALRHDAPIRFFMRRTAAATELQGVSLPADADVCALFPSANRDPAHYPDPDDFDVMRDAGDHLAFGSGIHLCLGAPLLRLEVAELLTALIQRVDAIRSAGEPVPNPSPVIQGYVELPLRIAASPP